MTVPLSGEAISPPSQTVVRNVAVEQPGRLAISVVVQESSVNQPWSVTATQGGVALAVDYEPDIDRGYDNNDSASLITQVAVVVVEQPGEVLVTVDTSSGTAQISGFAAYPPLTEGGITQTYAAGAHSGPLAIIDSAGRLLEVRVEIGTDRPFLFIDGKREADLSSGVPSANIERHDTYHTTWALLRVSGGYLACAGWHNRRLWGRWAETPEGLADSTPFVISPHAQNSTYVRLASSGTHSDTAWVLIRTGSTGSTAPVALIPITGMSSSGASVGPADVMTAVRNYPRHLSVTEADGRDLVAFAYQHRNDPNGEVWGTLAAFVFDSGDGRIYNGRGTAVGKETRGTPSDPRFTGDLERELNQHQIASGYGLISANADGNRYVPWCLLRITDTSTRAFDSVFLFVDSDGAITDGFSPSVEARVVVTKGAFRHITSAGADSLGLGDARSYRVASSADWVDAASGTLKIYAGSANDQADRSHRIEAGTRDSYYEFGATGPCRVSSADISSIASGTDLESAIIQESLVPMNTVVRWFAHGPVQASGGAMLAETCVGELHQTGQVGRFVVLGLPEVAAPVRSPGGSASDASVTTFNAFGDPLQTFGAFG